MLPEPYIEKVEDLKAIVAVVNLKQPALKFCWLSTNSCEPCSIISLFLHRCIPMVCLMLCLQLSFHVTHVSHHLVYVKSSYICWMHGPLKKSTRPPCRLSEAQDHPTHSCCICLQAGFTCVCEMSLLFMSRVGFGWQQSALVMRQCLHLDDDNPRRPDSFTVACVIERCCEFETDTMLQVWVNWLLCCCYAAIVLWDNMSVKCHGKCCHNWSQWFAHVGKQIAQLSQGMSPIIATDPIIDSQLSQHTFAFVTTLHVSAAACLLGIGLGHVSPEENHSLGAVVWHLLRLWNTFPTPWLTGSSGIWWSIGLSWTAGLSGS